jgi:transcriptional regulator with XRE-family HTH domain
MQTNRRHNDPVGPQAEELMGLAGLLRAWRTVAGERTGLGKPLSQAEVAHAAGMSERWYRELERGATPRLNRDTIDRLAAALLLGGDEKVTLYHYTLGSAPLTRSSPLGDSPARSALQLNDAAWNIVGHNQAMADWLPWVLEPGANLMRWVLCSAEGREQLIGWDGHARIYLAMIRQALARFPNDLALTALLSEVLEDPDCRRFWNEGPNFMTHRDGHHFRLNIPRFAPGEIDVVSQVLVPASYPDLRFVVISWLGSEHEPQGSRPAPLPGPRQGR